MDAYDTIKDIPVEQALGLSGIDAGGANRIMPWQSYQSNIDSRNGNLITRDSSTGRVLIGNQTTFGEGLFVSKPGKEVSTITSAADFIFNSSQDAFKIVATGHLTTPVLSATAGASASAKATVQTTVAHGLSFVPAYVSFIYGSGTVTPLPMTDAVPQASTTSMFFTKTWITVDSTNVVANDYVAIQNFSGGNLGFSGGQNTIYFYLFQETANPS